MVDYGIINSLDIDELIIMKKNQEYLRKHPYAIWQSKDGKYWYTTFPDPSKDRGVKQIRRNSKKELEQAIIEFWQNRAGSPTVQQVFEEWNNYKLETKKIIQSTYLRLGCIFRSHFEEMANKPVDEIKPIDWCEYLEKIIVSHDLIKSEFSHLKGIVIGIVKWSYKHGLIDYSTSSVLDMLDVSAKAFSDTSKDDEEEVFSEEETPRIIEYLEDKKVGLNLGLLLMFVTGVRAGELMALRHCDIDGNILRVRRTVTLIRKENGKSGWGIKESPKTRKGFRDIIVPEEYRWLMDELSIGEPEALVFTTSGGNIIKHETLCNALKRVCKDLDIPYRTPHKIRKTYTSILLDNNVDSRFVMEQVGHTNLSMTEGVYHKNRKTMDKKVEIINGIKDFGKHN